MYLTKESPFTLLEEVVNDQLQLKETDQQNIIQIVSSKYYYTINFKANQKLVYFAQIQKQKLKKEYFNSVIPFALTSKKQRQLEQVDDYYILNHQLLLADQERNIVIPIIYTPKRIYKIYNFKQNKIFLFLLIKNQFYSIVLSFDHKIIQDTKLLIKDRVYSVAINKQNLLISTSSGIFIIKMNNGDELEKQIYQILDYSQTEKINILKYPVQNRQRQLDQHQNKFDFFTDQNEVNKLDLKTVQRLKRINLQ